MAPRAQTSGSARQGVGTFMGHKVRTEPVGTVYEVEEDDYCRDPGLRTIDTPGFGGPVNNPRRRDIQRQALETGCSNWDVGRLATPAYHCGKNGSWKLDKPLLQKCGYMNLTTHSEVTIILCTEDMIAVHDAVWRAWYQQSQKHGFVGPQTQRILDKHLASLPRLRGTSARELVEFYEALQKKMMPLMVALTPFDAVILKYGFEGLCPPAMGTERYGIMAKAMFDVLPSLLPVSTDSEVSSLISVVDRESRNGYDLIWRVMALGVPGFSSKLSPVPPAYVAGDDVFAHATAFDLFFRLEA